MSRRNSTGVADPSSAIFIGNSFFYYNNGITSHLTSLIAAAAPGRPWRSTLAGISGARAVQDLGLCGQTRDDCAPGGGLWAGGRGQRRPRHPSGSRLRALD